MKLSIVALTSMLFFSLTGCTPVKFYSDPALTKSTGLKYYTAKPYIQVEKDSQSGAIVKATVLYLADLSNPQYIKINGGPGSKKLDMDLNNGIVDKFGFTSDSKIPDTIESMAAAVSKSADAIKDLSNLKGLPQATVSTVTELYEVIMNSEGTSLKKVEFK